MRCIAPFDLILVLAWTSAVLGLDFELPRGDLIKGQAYTFRYVPSDGIAGTISLVRWLGTGLGPIATLNLTARDGEFAWTPWSFLTPAHDYAFAVTQDSNTVYSNTFVIRDKDTLLPPAGASSSALVASTPPPTPTSSVISEIPDSALKPREKAGIGVSAAIAALLVASGAYFLNRSIRKRSKARGSDAESRIIGEYKPELKGHPLYCIYTPPEMDADGSLQELHQDSIVGEMGGQCAPRDPQLTHELHGQSNHAEIDSKNLT